ncbi:STAS domain-containing protein [[Actinomadura] parvosata]|uniref:STAS domain-containing protein n=1 Tax=[Actinomadura] parvosata TaxID=1955412 RepID=UPI00406D06D2
MRLTAHSAMTGRRPSSSAGTSHPSGTTTRAGAEHEDLLHLDPSLCITRSQRPGSCLLRLNGEIDSTNCAAVAAVLAGAGQQEGTVVLDAGRLSFADVAGLRMLSTVAARHGLRVRNVPHRTRQLLALLRLPALP